MLVSTGGLDQVAAVTVPTARDQELYASAAGCHRGPVKTSNTFLECVVVFEAWGAGASGPAYPQLREAQTGASGRLPGTPCSAYNRVRRHLRMTTIAHPELEGLERYKFGWADSDMAG